MKQDLKKAEELYSKAVEFGIKEAFDGLIRVVKKHEIDKGLPS